MDAIKLNVKPREAGKKHARAARRNQEVPCVLYGHGIEPITFQVAELDLRPLIYTADTHTVELTLDGETHTAILKSLVMHPVTDRPYHADFQALKRGEAIRMTVPVQFHGTPRGVRDSGGEMEVARHELHILVLPKDLPSHIDVDVTELGAGEAIHVRELQLPEGVTVLDNPDTTLVSVHGRRGGALDVAEEAGEEQA